MTALPAGWRRRAVLGLALGAIGVAAAVAAPAGGPADFLDRLEGAWSGQAVTTPIGPRPYDLHFRRTPEGHLDGAAEPGASTHHWSFRRQGDGLVLRFLSTFAGNSEPIWLDAADPRAPEVLFQARRPEFLRVRIRPDRTETRIRIFHRERLHVEIRLTRASPP